MVVRIVLMYNPHDIAKSIADLLISYKGISISGQFDPVKNRAFIFIIMGALCIAFAPIFVRLSELPPTATAFYRMLLASPLFILWLIHERRKKPLIRAISKHQRSWLLLTALLFTGDLAIWHWSIAFTSVANATLIANFSPIFVTWAAYFLFKEVVRRQFLVGMILALGGAGFLVWSSIEVGSNHLIGDILALAAAIFYSGYLIGVKDLRRTMTTSEIMAYSTMISTVALLVITLLAGETLLPETVNGWLVLIGLALISQVFGQGMIAYGLAHLPAGFSAVSLLVQPVGAAFLAWLILGETLTGWQGIGAVAVLAGIALARRGSVS